MFKVNNKDTRTTPMASTGIFIIVYWYTCRSSLRRCFMKKSGFKNFATFTGKHLYRGLFLIKLQSFRHATFNFIENPLQHGCFRVNISKIWRTLILKNTCEWLLLNLNIAAWIVTGNDHHRNFLIKQPSFKFVTSDMG